MGVDTKDCAKGSLFSFRWFPFFSTVSIPIFFNSKVGNLVSPWHRFSFSGFKLSTLFVPTTGDLVSTPRSMSRSATLTSTLRRFPESRIDCQNSIVFGLDAILALLRVCTTMFLFNFSEMSMKESVKKD